MKMKKTVAVGVAVSMLCLLTGCGDAATDAGQTTQAAQTQQSPQETQETAVETGSEESTEGQAFKVGNIMITSAGQSDQLNDQAIHDFFEERGGEVVTLDMEIDIVKANQCIEDLIALGVDGIVLNGISWEGHNSAIREAYDAGIPVIVGYNRVTCDEYVIAQVHSDDYGAGVAAGEDCIEKTGGTGKVFILDNPGASCVEDRTDGFEATVVEAGMTVAATMSCSGVEDSQATVSDLLQAHPDVAAIMCNCDLAATGAIAALRAAGLAGEVLVYAVDGNQENLQFIADGMQAGTSFTNNYNIGYTMAETMYNYLCGETIEEKDISLPITFVNSDNVQEFLEK